MFGANNSNAYRPLATDEAPVGLGLPGDNTQQSINVNQSSAAGLSSPRYRRRGHVTWPTAQVPALQTIPEEEQGEPEDNSNTNNSLLLSDNNRNSCVANISNSNVNNSAVVRLRDADVCTPSPSPSPPITRRRRTVVELDTDDDDDGFETVDLFTA